MGFWSTLLYISLIAIVITIFIAFIVFLIPTSAQTIVGLIGIVLGTFISFLISKKIIKKTSLEDINKMILRTIAILIPLFGIYPTFRLFQMF